MWVVIILLVVLCLILLYTNSTYSRPADLVITHHDAGFFSCCSVKLDKIIEYVKLNKKLPEKIDASQQFKWYKKGDEDLTYEYFTNDTDTVIDTNIAVDYKDSHQWYNFKDLDYDKICPYVTKYFTPSKDVNQKMHDIETKYNIDYENTCVLFYRGNDKAREMTLPSYDYYSETANNVLQENPNVKFLIQSDETEFIEFISEKFPDNSFYFKDEIRHMRKTDSTVDKVKDDVLEFSKKFLAITNIMSKCKYVVCASGNCSIWIMLYRKNSDGVFQFR